MPAFQSDQSGYLATFAGTHDVVCGLGKDEGFRMMSYDDIPNRLDDSTGVLCRLILPGVATGHIRGKERRADIPCFETRYVRASSRRGIANVITFHGLHRHVIMCVDDQCRS